MITKPILDKLEYSKVLTFIANFTSTEIGKEKILSAKPFNKLEEAEQEGQFVYEAKEILINADYPPFTYIPNLNEDLALSQISGTILTQSSIKNILGLAENSRKIFTYLKVNGSDTDFFNSIKDNFFIDRNFENLISNVFNPSGEISDNASKKLKEIRKEIIFKTNNLKTVIDRILKSFKDSYLVRDEYVTQRDGRLVLPIKAEHKRHVKGFIHSESNTGQTVYIEPEATLELNNEILSLNFAEKREIERILKELTVIIGKNAILLKKTLDLISYLDVVFAKAKYSIEIIGSFPKLNKTKKINIIDARHPILLKKIKRDKTIPLNFNFIDNNVTLITGPNAGGKTVVLKTIGLLTALVQSGIHIPVAPDSDFYFFEKIMLDIGDEQSIEDDLSTFSSHLSNIKSILEEADNSSLILIDEIGTGTDPSEGTALAAAFLIKLKDKGAVTIATTHHGNLKIIASELENFQNASMEYDLKKLEPTYKFRQGTPGSSYAFEVAHKIGLDENLLNSAKKYLDSDKNKVENFIIDLENKSLELNKKLNELEIENSRLKGLSNLYEKENQKLKEQKSKILSETKKEAESFLKDVNSKFENTIKRIKESKADKTTIKEEKEKLTNLKIKIAEKYSNTTNEDYKSKKFNVGDYVRIKDSLTSGEIKEIDSAKGNVTIDAGGLRIKAKIKTLEHTKSKKETVKQIVDNSSFVSLDSTRLDIRGKKPEEIDFELVKFIDDAHLSGVKQIEIIHGKGTGVLRKNVHQILKNHEFVNTFSLAEIEFGGAGATTVILK
ncbi:MAG: endonuclease MutS2 [Ignavibacteriae bacterium]|nr:MAG: endonuclease MutS2 [Ignavibacteriota bacterium]